MHQRTKIAVAVAVAINSMTVFAQTAEPALQRVEVTGSRIRAVDLETAQPVLKMTAAEIQKSGLVTVGDILNTLTSAGSPDFSKGSVLTSNREMGGQFLNLRHLGSERLLVLVNGKRWSQSVDGYTDMSTIPSSMVDRVEILKDGASSIYGSDAIAGVVNIILKKKMVGGEASAYVGRNSKGDGQTQDYSIAYGAGNDTANLMFGMSHSKQDQVLARDRAITSTTYGPDHPNDALGAGPFGRYRQVAAATGAATGLNRTRNHTGDAFAPGVATGNTNGSRDDANYHTGTVAVQDSYNSTQDMQFLAPSQLSTIFTKGTVELPKDVRFTTTAMFSQRKAGTQVAGYPLNSLSQVANPVYVDKDSYYNPIGNQAVNRPIVNGVQLAGQDAFFYRRVIENKRLSQNKNNTFHLDAALEGDFKIADKEWNWSVGANHSSVSGSTMSSGNVNLVTLKKALGPSFLDTDGVVKCGAPGKLIVGCVPFDILGGPGSSTPQALAYINHIGGGSYSSTTNSFTADVGGELFTLPAGAVGLAAGLEQRDVRGYDRPDALERQALTTNLSAQATVGSYSVKEAYIELNVPVLKGMPLAELLSFNVASRYSDYSNFGDTTNSKLSFMWKPIKDLLVRGTVAEGFRAPALGDTFGGGSQSFDSYIDACDSVFGSSKGTSATATTIRAACAAQGVPANFRQLQQSGIPIAAAGAQTVVAFNTGVGNDSLTPETATTKTFGFVYNPSYVPGLTLGMDYFDIEVKNRISAIGVAYTLNQCYQFGVQEFCDKFTRDPVTKQINSLSRGNKNMGSMATKGVDLDLSYRMKRGAYGQFGVKTQTTYLDTYMLQSTNVSEKFNYAGEYPYYRLKSNIVFDWNMGNWSATFGTRFFSKAKGTGWDCDPEAPVECSDPTGQSAGFDGYDLKSAQSYSDLSVGYATPWKGKILVGVNNVFGKKPRRNYDAAASATTVDADVPLDRFVFVRYNQSF